MQKHLHSRNLQLSILSCQLTSYWHKTWKKLKNCLPLLNRTSLTNHNHLFSACGRSLGFTIFLSFFLKLSSKNRASLLGSVPITRAILAAGPSSLSIFPELELLFLESFSFLELELEVELELTTSSNQYNWQTKTIPATKKVKLL